MRTTSHLFVPCSSARPGCELRDTASGRIEIDTPHAKASIAISEIGLEDTVIDAGGLVGRHVGDGVVAFFLTETAGSESAAASACIAAARALRAAVRDVAARSELQPEDVVLRFGLHWGSTLYVGNISTGGRSEVTALGDEVNEAARIEACATGGRALASKSLIERLDPDDSARLGLDPDRVTYTPLTDLATATEKARRDAPAIAVCDVTE